MLRRLKTQCRREETGYYYGARYYDAQASVWLGVDEMTEKYPGWSPYNYTLNNPVIYVDPDGRDIDLGNLYKKVDGEYVNKRQILAFELFASTKTGKEFIMKRA